MFASEAWHTQPPCGVHQRPGTHTAARHPPTWILWGPGLPPEITGDSVGSTAMTWRGGWAGRGAGGVGGGGARAERARRGVGCGRRLGGLRRDDLPSRAGCCDPGASWRGSGQRHGNASAGTSTCVTHTAFAPHGRSHGCPTCTPGFFSLRNLPVPLMVPPVPTPATKMSTCPCQRGATCAGWVGWVSGVKGRRGCCAQRRRTSGQRSTHTAGYEHCSGCLLTLPSVASQTSGPVVL